MHAGTYSQHQAGPAPDAEPAPHSHSPRVRHCSFRLSTYLPCSPVDWRSLEAQHRAWAIRAEHPGRVYAAGIRCSSQHCHRRVAAAASAHAQHPLMHSIPAALSAARMRCASQHGSWWGASASAALLPAALHSSACWRIVMTVRPAVPPMCPLVHARWCTPLAILDCHEVLPAACPRLLLHHISLCAT